MQELEFSLHQDSSAGLHALKLKHSPLHPRMDASLAVLAQGLSKQLQSRSRAREAPVDKQAGCALFGTFSLELGPLSRCRNEQVFKAF